MRLTYKTVLRCKGIKPLPKAATLRSSLTVKGEHVVASQPKVAA